MPAELGDLNPYNTMPTLVDRELVLYESKVMMEYLDERFPIRPCCRFTPWPGPRVGCLFIALSVIGPPLSTQYSRLGVIM
ncbi:MAG: hypothetical protein CM15mP74_01160 [Halieaceae bacterium]|nr:MAG: hypothetical protein CM15mP74_01160 [Halieaceae bacterium]